MSDMAGAQFLRLGGKAQESIDLAVHETLDGFDRCICHPANVLGGVKAELGPDKGQQHVQGRPQGLHSDAPAFQVGDPANTLVPEQTIQPTWMPASSVIGSPASIDWTNCEA